MLIPQGMAWFWHMHTQTDAVPANGHFSVPTGCHHPGGGSQLAWFKYPVGDRYCKRQMHSPDSGKVNMTGACPSVVCLYCRYRDIAIVFYIMVPTWELANEAQSRREFAVCRGLHSPRLPAGMRQWGSWAYTQLFGEQEWGERMDMANWEVERHK